MVSKDIIFNESTLQISYGKLTEPAEQQCYDHGILPQSNKSVTFALQKNEIHIVDRKCNKKLARDIWYSEADLRAIERKNKKIAKGFKRGSLVEGNDSTHTGRGLEELIDSTAFRDNMVVQFASMEAVMQEQERQQIISKSGYPDYDSSSAIAAAYVKFGAEISQHAAYARGQRDYENSMTQIDKEETTYNTDDSSVASGSKEKTCVRLSLTKNLKSIVRKSISLPC